MAKPEPTQIHDGVWYAVAHGGAPFFEECCGCGLTHRQQWKVENGRIFFRYTVDRKATKAARARRRREKARDAS